MKTAGHTLVSAYDEADALNHFRETRFVKGHPLAIFSDIAAITNDSVTAAGNLITKLKKAGLIEAVGGYGKGNTLSRILTDKTTARYQRKADNGQFVRHIQVQSK